MPFVDCPTIIEIGIVYASIDAAPDCTRTNLSTRASIGPNQRLIRERHRPPLPPETRPSRRRRLCAASGSDRRSSIVGSRTTRVEGGRVMVTVVTLVKLREGSEPEWDAVMRERMDNARVRDGWIRGQILMPLDRLS